RNSVAARLQEWRTRAEVPVWHDGDRRQLFHRSDSPKPFLQTARRKQDHCKCRPLQKAQSEIQDCLSRSGRRDSNLENSVMWSRPAQFTCPETSNCGFLVQTLKQRALWRWEQYRQRCWNWPSSEAA